MKEDSKLPEIIPIFPLSNFIIFPKTTVPLNIFEPRYIQMIDDSMKSHRLIGMIQPKKSGELKKPDLYQVGCVGKITSFNETDDGRYLIIINGVSRFSIREEINSDKLYRLCKVSYQNYYDDQVNTDETLVNKDLEKIFSDLKNLFEKQGYMVDWSDLKKNNFANTLNTLSMASPFSLEEKQILLETKDLNTRKLRLEEIIKTYIYDNFRNKTLQ
jgi:Lon protease-like protein